MELVRNSAQLRPLRGKDPLESWVRSFARHDPERATRYLQALAAFLGTGESGPEWASYVAHKSPATRRAYREAVAEFFEFLAAKKGRVVPPHEVTRADADAYAEWLANRGKPGADFRLGPEKLKDGDRPDELGIYETVVRLGRASLPEIAREMPRSARLSHPAAAEQQATQLVDEAWLHERLSWLVMQKLLQRSPTMVELRSSDPRAGLDGEIDRSVFVYFLPQLRPTTRSTITARLGALSSFWRVMQRGENTGGKALLQYNVFEDTLRRVSRGVKTEKRMASMARRPPPELVRRVLAAADGPRLVDKRNVALLWFLLLMGTRIGETLALRRGEPGPKERSIYPGWLELDGTPPVVMLIRKGGKRQKLAVPSYVVAALRVFWSSLSRMYPEDVTEDDLRYRYKLLMREPDAPLFPPLRLWGANLPDWEGERGRWDYRKSLNRTAVVMLLCRICKKAGLTDKERSKIYPHGFRHSAAQGMVDGHKSLREVQAMLGHSSITTTEGYLHDETDPTKLSGQAEILEWLGGAPPPTGAPPERPTASPAVSTPGPRPHVTVVEVKPSPAASEPGQVLVTPPSHQLPVGPEPPEPLALPAVPDKERLVALGEVTSLPGPVQAYDDLFHGKKPQDLTWSGTPQSKWIDAHYPRLPPGIGIGKDSLLLWWEKNAPLPWPVLAPAQAYPELAAPGSFLEKLEAVYDTWTRTRPTQTLALAKWLWFLGLVTVGLEERLNGEYLWVPYATSAQLDRDLRAHDDDWLVRWFETNAHTFTVAKSKFEEVPHPESGEPGGEFWERIRETVAIASSQPTTPDLPDWFFEQDPIEAIYERSPEEWRAFRSWLLRLTGQQEKTRRDEHREEQRDFFEEATESRESRLRGYLDQIYNLVDELKEGVRDRDAAEQRALGEQLGRLKAYVKATFGLAVPSEAPAEPMRRRRRIDELVARTLGVPAPPAPNRNVLGDSRLFSPDAFLVDETRHSLVHTLAFKREFERDHFGQDSECVMRRVARALWEYVRGHEHLGQKRRGTPAEMTRYLFLTMLSEMAYVVPCSDELERQLVEAGQRASTPAEIAQALRAVVERATGGQVPQTEAEETAAAILDVFYEGRGDDPRVAAQAAWQATQAAQHWKSEGSERERDERRTREAHRRRSLLQNPSHAGPVLPHPLRLAAASFWPV